MRRSSLATPARPFAHAAPTCAPPRRLAAVAITAGGGAVAYMQFDTDQPLDLGTDPRGVATDYEAWHTDHAAALARLLDQRLREYHRHSAVISGHDLAGSLKTLREAAEDMQITMACLGDVTALWPRRHEAAPCCGTLVDTAFDLETPAPDLQALCARARLSGRYLMPEQDSWRPAVTRAMASALLTARAMGWCSWAQLDLDAVVNASVRRAGTTTESLEDPSVPL